MKTRIKAILRMKHKVFNDYKKENISFGKCVDVLAEYVTKDIEITFKEAFDECIRFKDKKISDENGYCAFLICEALETYKQREDESKE